MHILTLVFFVCDHVCIYMRMIRSGTEKEYTELQQLLEDIASYQRDYDMKKAEEKKTVSDKKLDEKKKGEEMRKAAIEGMSSM